MLENVKLTTYPSSLDLRDFVYEQSTARLQESVDLREWDSPVDDQYQLGSCVGNAIASAYELQVKRLYPQYFVELSRLFIYYNARKFYGETLEDTGTTIRAGIKAVRKYGVCAESLWPYDLEKFDDEPSAEAYADAKSRNITSYKKLYTTLDIMDALVNKQPVVIAVDVYDNFMLVDSFNSTIPMPGNSTYYGGHAMCIVGYDISTARFLVKNSFGTEWGDKGYCWMPFLYAEKYVFEKWVFNISDPTILHS